MTKKISGTKEWAVATVNCVSGCGHLCRYCYARYNMVERFKRMTHAEWETKNIRPRDVRKKQKHFVGPVMFPTTHDICPETLDACITVIGNILKADNDILIVSKPHLDCITAICDKFVDHKDHILFRFTIGAQRDDILSYWEPGAPKFAERLASLKLAFERGYKTSVSCEPMLDSEKVTGLFYELEPFVTDSIWIGKLNNIENRVKIVTPEDQSQVDRIIRGQTDERIKVIYQMLKNQTKVKWKESFKEVLGLDLSTEAGLDS